MDVTDRQLLTRYRRGNVEALEALVEKYRRPLFGFIVNMTRGRDEAEEIFQEVWFRVIRKHGMYRHDNFCGWLVRIAHNVIIDRSRRRKPDMRLDEVSEEGLSMAQVIAGKEPDAGAKLEAQDLKERMAKAVETLPEEQKEVFLMRMQMELSFKEIARAQKVSINTALARMQYALKKLRTTLSGDYEALKKTV